jgi:hypothetical protein
LEPESHSSLLPLKTQTLSQTTARGRSGEHTKGIVIIASSFSCEYGKVLGFSFSVAKTFGSRLGEHPQDTWKDVFGSRSTPRSEGEKWTLVHFDIAIR